MCLQNTFLPIEKSAFTMTTISKTYFPHAQTDLLCYLQLSMIITTIVLIFVFFKICFCHDLFSDFHVIREVLYLYLLNCLGWKLLILFFLRLHGNCLKRTCLWRGLRTLLKGTRYQFTQYTVWNLHIRLSSLR